MAVLVTVEAYNWASMWAAACCCAETTTAAGVRESALTRRLAAGYKQRLWRGCYFHFDMVVVLALSLEGVSVGK